jgi:HD superfamily phosphodiesterase
MVISPDKFILRAHYFDFKSPLHGIGHTYRVMCNSLALGKRLKFGRESRLALCSAFIHDMARKHDGKCTMHGAWAAEEKLPLFRDLFLSIGVMQNEIEEIRIAVTNHSLPEELPSFHDYYVTTAILKDADALDRIRLGDSNLKPDFLRFGESRELIPFSERLYHQTNGITDLDFDKTLKTYASLVIT